MKTKKSAKKSSKKVFKKSTRRARKAAPTTKKNPLQKSVRSAQNTVRNAATPPVPASARPSTQSALDTPAATPGVTATTPIATPGLTADTSAQALAPLPVSKGNAGCVGVDVAKDKLDYALLDGSAGQVANTLEGIATLIEKCRELGGPFVICEATGGYERRMVGALLDANINVAVVPPARARHFANGHALHAKTDANDARMLARLGNESECVAYRGGPEYIVKLRGLLEARHCVVNRLVQLQGLLEAPPPETLKQLKKEKAWQEKQKENIEELIEAHIKSTPELDADTSRLRQVRGFGPIFAATLLGYVPELRQIKAKRLCALVGVVPIPDDSGKRYPRAHIGGGRKAVRDVLRMGAISAIKHNPVVRHFYTGLRARNKPFRVCVVAVMRKMLMLSHHLLINPEFTLA
jgi:transposase